MKEQNDRPSVRSCWRQRKCQNFEHCATRLRLILKDDQLVDKDKAEAVEGSKGYFFNTGQHQFILEQEKSMKFIKPSQQKWAMTPPLIKLASKMMCIRICHPSKSCPHVVRCLGAIDSSFGNDGAFDGDSGIIDRVGGHL